MAGITLAEPVPSPARAAASDAEFLEQVQWAEDADAGLVRAARAGDLKRFWTLLTKQVFGLGARVHRRKVQERRYSPAMSLWANSESTPLADIWRELSKRWESARQPALTHRTKKKNKSADANGQPAALKISRKSAAGLTDWLESPSRESPSEGALLILAEMLRLVGHSLPAKIGIPLWRRLLLAAGDSANPSESETGASAEPKIVHTGELPWIMGLLFSHVSGSESLRERGRQTVQSHLEEYTDTDGTLRAQEMERFAEWLPPVVRAAEWAYAAEEPLWEKKSQQRFQALMNRVAGCVAGDGHLAFDRTKCPYALPMLLTAARLAGGSKKEWPLKFLLEVAEAQPELLTGIPSQKQSAKLKTSRRRIAEANTDSLVQQSDWARLACLRTHAGPEADVFAVAHHQSLPKIDFSILGHGIIQGPWGLEVSIDQKPITGPSEWTCVCWHTDSDGDYVELQYTIDENRRIERQVFLSRPDHFLVMADCVSGAGEAVVDYTARWPLVPHAEVAAHPFSRERIVTLGNLRMRTFPLALPEDVVHSTAGRWGLSENTESPSLELRQSAVGGVYAPVVFDWTPARQNAEADWRTLTVTENGRKVQCDRACGYRLRIGNQQLLIYRSLTPTDELRTVLGHHTGHESIIARFDKKGDVKPLLIVE